MIDWEEQGSVPQLAEANGIAAPSTCRAGAWGTCAARVLEGSVVYAAETVAAPGPACALLCIAKPDAVGKAGREAVS
nr:2Fe-2S iron-sulfur cluster-binding protein [Paraburkholderia atlantica]